MDELTRRNLYRADVASGIEALGTMAVSVANRWIMGWPERVAALLKSGAYLEHLAHQVAQEKTILANEPNLRHLSRHEILQIYEIREAPPW